MTTPLSVRIQIKVHRLLGGGVPHAISYAGVRVVPARAKSGPQVTWDHMLDVIRGLDMLPRDDIHTLAVRKIPIVVNPTSAWKDAQSGSMLIGGAFNTRKVAPGERWVPKRIDLAAFAPDRAGSTPRAYLHNVVRHEVGHVISTLQRQDRSEEAAEAYRVQTAAPDLATTERAMAQQARTPVEARP